MVDDFLHNRGLSEAEGISWVVVPEPGASKILAFYTINPDPLTDFVDDDFTETVELIEISWLGVSVDHTGQYIGTRMLIRVIKQILLCAEDYQITGLVLTALNDKAKAWYLHLEFGFQEFRPGSRRLFLSIETMRQSPIASQLLEW